MFCTECFVIDRKLKLVVFVSEPKTLVKGDFETVKTTYFLKIRRQSCIER